MRVRTSTPAALALVAAALAAVFSVVASQALRRNGDEAAVQAAFEESQTDAVSGSFSTVVGATSTATASATATATATAAAIVIVSDTDTATATITVAAVTAIVTPPPVLASAPAAVPLASPAPVPDVVLMASFEPEASFGPEVSFTPEDSLEPEVTFESVTVAAPSLSLVAASSPLPPPGVPCSTAGSLIPPTPCPDGQVCVIEDFGFPAVDKPNAGSCASVDPDQETCTVELCSDRGADGLCTVPAQLYVSTCGAWANRSDGGEKPDCGIVCTQECLEDGPVDNNGKRYCNLCILQAASCASNFEVFRVAPLPPPLPTDSDCTTQRTGPTPPKPCPNGTVCVINDFGFIAADKVNSGSCMDIDQSQPMCSVDLCAETGAETTCEAPGRNFVTMCGVWATETKPKCGRPCQKNCLVDMLMDNEGGKYCNLCTLQVASCNSDFRLYGPIDGAPMLPPGGARCSTAGSMIPVTGPPCENGDVCVIDDFGLPAADNPNSGTCMGIAPKQPGCTVDHCSQVGANGFCTVAEQLYVSTCGAWAVRSDGGEKPDCSFACRDDCVLDDSPVDNEGNGYCNPCQLRLASCMSNFELFEVPPTDGGFAAF